jgi:hypothetical protein
MVPQPGTIPFLYWLIALAVCVCDLSGLLGVH